jgi:hypothetical protein
LLKVPKCEIFDLFEFSDFFIRKSLKIEDFRDEIKIFHFLQMSEIRAILFCYMRHLR